MSHMTTKTKRNTIARLTFDGISHNKNGEIMSKIEITKTSAIEFNTDSVDFLNDVKSDCTFKNPLFISNDKHGYSNYETDEYLEVFRDLPYCLEAPRGYLTFVQNKRIIDHLSDRDNVDFIDESLNVPIKFRKKLIGINLRDYQETALKDVGSSMEGVIVAPTGSGKTIIALELIRRIGQKTIIVVHRKELAKQWMEVIKERFGFEAGFLGSGKFKDGKIVVAMLQSIVPYFDKVGVDKFPEFGNFIMDECHHCPCSQLMKAQYLLPARYRFGFTATTNRRDGLERIIYLAMGYIVSEIERDTVEDIGGTVPIVVKALKTDFDPGYCDSWAKYIDKISESHNRNVLILNIAINQKLPSLILVDRIVHANNLAKILTENNIGFELAHGKARDKKTMLKRIRNAKITIGTTSLIGEGIDVSSWGSIVMGSPISSEIKLMQAIGRVSRPSKGKDSGIVFDLKDDCGFAGGSFKKRMSMYDKADIKVNFIRKDQAYR